MRRYNIFIGLLLLVFTLSSASALQTLTDCKTSGWIEGETYELQNDISYDGVCLNIDASNIIINGNGYTIGGNVVIYDRVNIVFENVIINPSSGIGILSQSNSRNASFVPYILIIDHSTVYGGIVVSSYICTMCAMGNGGKVKIQDSTVHGKIEANGGTNPGEDATAGNGGRVEIINSDVEDVSADGGVANQGVGSGGTILMCGSTTGDLSVEGTPEGTILDQGNLDTDNDGALNCLDLDDDGDNVLDHVDLCPLVSTLGYDVDHNGCMDNLYDLNNIISTLPQDVISNDYKIVLNSHISKAIKDFETNKYNSLIKSLNEMADDLMYQKTRKISPPTANMLSNYVKNIVATLRINFVLKLFLMR
ncbi:MAG: hypothetical protein ACP5NZ_02495 [Nanobdellota archaeon]